MKRARNLLSNSLVSIRLVLVHPIVSSFSLSGLESRYLYSYIYCNLWIMYGGFLCSKAQ